MINYSQHFQTLTTPQTEQAHPAQVPNSGGGFSFAVSSEQRLMRWLILGAEGGSYYATERKLTIENAKTVQDCLRSDPHATIETIATVSEQGRAPKNDAAIFALAIAAGHSDQVARSMALAALPRVCRTATHLFQFVQAVRGFRGWGKGLRRAVANWYETKSERDLCYQLAKYEQRGGMSHRDVFRLAHPTLRNPAIARYVVAGAGALGEREVTNTARKSRHYPATGPLPAYLSAFDELKQADEQRTIALISEHKFTHEMIRTEHKNSRAVWEALLPDMLPGALLRNLGKLTSVGVIAPLSDAAKLVATRFGDATTIRKARLHPLAILSAMRVYAQGHGDKGSLTWAPNTTVIDALNETFYLAFENVEPTGKSTLLALDVSGSMGCATCSGLSLTPREVSAALALVTARREPNCHIVGFSDGVRELAISPRQRLDDVIRSISELPFSATDCSAPMIYAARQGLDVDTFHVYTDSETQHGGIHPHQALREYRNHSGRNAKLAVVGMVSNGFTIAHPDDPGMIDIVGCDTSTPNLLAEFARW